MKARTKAAMAAAALLAVVGATGLAGQTAFSDVGTHDLGRDIYYAVDEGWFQGYDDGTFKPDRTITPKQIATVIGRAFPDGSTRGEMASFLRGGRERVDAPNPTVGATDKAVREDVTFDYAFVLVQVWIADAHDSDLITMELKNQEDRVINRLQDEWYLSRQDPYEERLWHVVPGYEYILEVGGLGADDAVEYQFSQLLPTLRYSTDGGGTDA